MHPILFKLSDSFTIYSFGFFIVIGAISGLSYVGYQANKKYNTSFDTINSLFLLLLISAIVGGKFILFFERPGYYSENFTALLTGRGFVFYGSLLFCIPAMLYFFKKQRLPVLPMLDIMAVTTCIVHFFGRIGCFMAGCCHGIEWHGPLAVTFTDEACLAPLNVSLHPTQLYSSGMILIILLILLLVKRIQKFDGQLFMLYLMLYALGRSVLDIFRGDLSRGFIVENYISNSQFISFIVISISGYIYYRLSKQPSMSIND